MCGTNQQPCLFSRPSIRFLTPSRDNGRTLEGVELLSPTLVTCGVSFSTWAAVFSEQLKAPEGSSLCTWFPADWAAADSENTRLCDELLNTQFTPR